MDDISKIWSGASPVGSDLTGKGNYRIVRKPVDKKAPTSFRTGEIIQGKILDIPERGITKIRLPNGIFRATLHESLKPGDELFFLVSETDPSLVLKAHSILTGRAGAYPDVSEILRLLNLPDSEIFRSTAELLYETESIIKRDEIITLEKNFRDIFGEGKLNKLIPRLSMIRDFIMSGAVIDNVDLDRLLPFYESEKIITDLIKVVDSKTQDIEVFIALSRLMGNDSLTAKQDFAPIDLNFLKKLAELIPNNIDISEIVNSFNSFFAASDYRASIPQFADNYLMLIFAGIASGKFVIHKFKTRKKKKTASIESFIASLFSMGFREVWNNSKDSRGLMSGISSILMKESNVSDFKIIEYKLFSSGGKYILFSTPQDIHSSKISVVL